MWRRARAASGTEAGARDEAIVAEISARDVSGQILAGNHNVQIHADHGAIVYAGGAPAVRERPVPVTLLPRDFPGLLGREQELAEMQSALAGGATVGVVAASGGGKTSLLRRLAHLAGDALPHGVVFLRAAGQPREDVERFLFDAFWACDAPYQPTPFELRERLAERRALVVLDDLDQERDDVGELLDCAPGCRFLLASERRGLWGEERTFELGGLDGAAAHALLERELGRPLRDDERARAEDLCRRLGGRPLSVLQAAALARSGELPLVAPDELETAVRDDLADDERRVLHALGLLAPAAVHVDDVAAIAAVPDAAAVLERLRTRGAAQAHSPRWSATLAPERSPGHDRMLLRRAREQLATGADERPVEDVPAIVAALRADDDGPGKADALALARAADGLLTRSGRWGAWRVALERARVAAETLGDRAATAWALHQLGTRAGCLGDGDGAVPLRRALALRRELGDETGAAVSAHNLAQLFGPPPPVDGHGNGTGRGPSGPGLWAALGGGVLALGVALALLLGGNGSSPGSATPAAVTLTGPDGHVTTTVAPTVPPTTVPPTTVPPTTVPPTTVPPTTPAGGPTATLDIEGQRAYRADEDKGSLSVTNTGPDPIPIVPSVSSGRFAAHADCPTTLEVRALCRVFIDYRAEPGTVRATLSFAHSPSAVELTGEGETVTTTPVTTSTTTIPSPTTATTTSGGVLVR